MPFATITKTLVLTSALLAFSAGTTGAADLATEPNLPAQAYDYAIVGGPPAPATFDNAPAARPEDDARATLGRVLFYDRGLSANGLVSCSSCHAQASGFDDPSRFSIGFRGQITRRAAMALANSRYNPRGRYFRDERAATLEEQVLMPLSDDIEMGLKRGEVVERIGARSWYAPLFADAFGDTAVDEDRIAVALAAFVRAIVANQSRYDIARAENGDPLADFAQFSSQENRGKFLFLAPHEKGGAGCAACHETDAFVLARPRDNGLPADARRPDGGAGETTGDAGDDGKFRTASLKNVAVSAPYMHDGRFATLDDVLDHYSTGIVDRANLDEALRGQDGKPVRFEFSDDDRAALVAFLQTLTDETLLTDPRFSNPFLTD